MAGKEHSGMENADVRIILKPYGCLRRCRAEIYRPAARFWIIATASAPDRRTGCGRHDQMCAWISHLPQMISTALAATWSKNWATSPDLLAIGGRALREMTRIAASPYSMWRDIALTNTEH